MSHRHNEEYDQPRAPDPYVARTPASDRTNAGERATNKRPRSYISPPGHQEEISRHVGVTHPTMSHRSPSVKIAFPPVVVKFSGEKKATLKELTDDLTSSWKVQHGIELSINARFGHMQALLVFADDSSSFESLLSPNRWPKELKGQNMEVKIPRQLPPSYSLIIQQFHRTWNEEEWLTEIQHRYVSLCKITRMRVKDGSALNAVRADFKSVEEVQTLITLGKISIGSMIHPVKPYHLPIRINKCFKCLRHDHTTRACTSPRLCPKCAEEHSLEHGCPNHEKCINCGSSDHASGHSACAIVQEKRRALVEQGKKQKAEFLVQTERRFSQFDHK